MPASAPHPIGDEHAPVADVIDFASRRAAQRRGEPCAAPSVNRPTDEEIGAAEAWQSVLAVHGTSLSDPTTRSAVAAVADLLERLVLGARTLRESGNNTGLDEMGAQVMLDLIADMRGSAATLDAMQAIAEEC